jgi:hypothetical protein
MTSGRMQIYCLACGYDLTGLRHSRCPECGRSFDIADQDTYRRFTGCDVPWRSFLAVAFAVGSLLSWWWFPWMGVASSVATYYWAIAGAAAHGPMEISTIAIIIATFGLFMNVAILVT